MNELLHLVAQVDLSSAAKIIRFTDWQAEDGTKAGLEAVIEQNMEKA